MNRQASVILLPVLVGIFLLIAIGTSINRPSSRPDVSAASAEPREQRDLVVAAVPAAPARSGGSMAGAPTAPDTWEEPAIAETRVSFARVPEPVDPNAPGMVNLIVLEETTKSPLSSVRITLAREDSPDRPMHVLRTDERGSVQVRDLAPGSYVVGMRWGFGPPAPGGTFAINPAERTNHLAEYPGRVPLRFQLVDEEGNPLSNQQLDVGLSQFDESNPAAVHTESVRTSSDGSFTLMGYDRTGVHVISSPEAILFSTPRDRGRFDWSNPLVDFRRHSVDSEEATRIVGRVEAVSAIGRIRNMPSLERGQHLVAMIQGRGITQTVVPIDRSNEFRFAARPGTEVTVTLFRTRHSWSGGQSGSVAVNRRFAERIIQDVTTNGTSREHLHTERMPGAPGQHVFQMELQNRILVEGIVYGPDGEPASGVEVIARGARQEDVAAGRGVDNRAYMRAPRTSSDGRFQVELTESPEYTFLVERRTLPESARTFNYPRLSWQEITEGAGVTLFLQHSGLVAGEVVDEAGRPLEGIRVRLGGRGLSRGAREVVAVSGRDGYFELNVPMNTFGERGEREAPPLSYVYAVQRNRATGVATAVVNSGELVQLIMLEDVDVIASVIGNNGPLGRIWVEADLLVRELEWMGLGNRRRLAAENGVFFLGRFPRGITTLTISGGRGQGNERIHIDNDTGPQLDLFIDWGGGG